LTNDEIQTNKIRVFIMKDKNRAVLE